MHKWYKSARSAADHIVRFHAVTCARLASGLRLAGAPMRRHLLLFTGLSLAASCAKHEETEAHEVFPVSTPGASAERYEREYVGEVHAVQRAELRARTKGLLEVVSVDEGKQVKAGQLLFSFASKICSSR